MTRLIALAAGVALAAAAGAQNLREFCGDRPGLGTPACTVDRGHLQVELGLGDWTLDRQPESRADTILAGDLLLRYGAGETTELRLGWTAYGHQRERDRMTGAVARVARVGDVTLGVKQNLAGPDGKGTSVAILPEVSVPLGRRPIGDGDWGARLLVPADVDLAKAVQLQLRPEIDAAVDGDGHGRHLAYGGVAGLDFDLGETLDLTVEGEWLRDRDPEERATLALAGLSLAYKPQERTQLDIGTNIGLNRLSPDVEIYFGVSRKF